MVRLEDGVDFKCPRPDCGHGWSIESWDTEYGDPQPGIHQVYCSKCDRHVKLIEDLTH